jgi:hypothetical protein
VRLTAAILVSSLTGAAACASLSGLNDISLGDSDGGTSGHRGDGGDVAVSPGGDDGTVADGQAVPPGKDGGPTAETGAPDSDGAASPVDASTDAAAICRDQCSGCCDSSGTCHGGQSTATCGNGGLACRDCSSAGMVCTSGECIAKTSVESGAPTMCVVSKCTNSCPLLPLAEAPCCKPDNTCGCGAVLGILLCN